MNLHLLRLLKNLMSALIGTSFCKLVSWSPCPQQINLAVSLSSCQSISQYVSLTLICLLHAHGVIRPNSILHFMDINRVAEFNLWPRKNLFLAILDLEPEILSKPVFPTQGTNQNT